jgi:hypothetical protein
MVSDYFDSEAIHMSDTVDSILCEFIDARLHGLQKHGGANAIAHDFQHDQADWCSFLRDHVERARCGSPQEYREELAKIGGLALSAAFVFDNKP